METNATNTNAEAAQLTNALERRLDLAVAIADLDKEIDQRLRRISKNVKMPGFRPGKVPANIVKQQYGEQARYEALNEALERAFTDTVKAQQLRVAGQPSIEPKASESATHMEFSAVFEVYPEIKLGDLKEVEVERPVLEGRCRRAGEHDDGPAQTTRSLRTRRPRWRSRRPRYHRFHWKEGRRAVPGWPGHGLSFLSSAKAPCCRTSRMR